MSNVLIASIIEMSVGVLCFIAFIYSVKLKLLHNRTRFGEWILLISFTDQLFRFMFTLKIPSLVNLKNVSS